MVCIQTIYGLASFASAFQYAVQLFGLGALENISIEQEKMEATDISCFINKMFENSVSRFR